MMHGDNPTGVLRRADDLQNKTGYIRHLFGIRFFEKLKALITWESDNIVVCLGHDRHYFILGDQLWTGLVRMIDSFVVFHFPI